jgi:TonB family protein
VDPDNSETLKDIPVHPTPTYPLEARRQRWTGGALFVMRFRRDGSVEQVVTLKSTDKPVLDQECVRTFLRWHCVPGICTTALMPISFSLSNH